MKKLAADQSACGNYHVTSNLCKNCVRCIGFYSLTHHLWSTFNFTKDSNGKDACNGFKPKFD